MGVALERIKLDQPIDLRYKYKKGLLGRRKQVPTTLAEQRKLKKAFIQIYPDNLFIDDLFEKNSYLTEEQKRKCAKENRRALGEAMLASAVVDVACDFGDCGGDD